MIRRTLENEGIFVCAEAHDANGAIQAAQDHAPDVAILDVRMPGGGLYAAGVIADQYPEVKTVMLTVSDDDADLFAALSACASGYWLKGEDPLLLPRIVRRVAAGEMIVAGVLLKSIVKEWGVRDLRKRIQEHLPRGVQLTPKEYEVIELLTEGFNTAEIGKRLFIADVTVRTHIASVIRKLRVNNREQVLRMLRSPSPKKDSSSN
jgi:two-component system nitrate/nitrite response regulator NarL